MHKTVKMSAVWLTLLACLFVSCKKSTHIWQGITYEPVSASEAPFPMSDVKVPVFPDRYFPITDYGARSLPDDGGGYPSANDSSLIIHINIHAFEQAMADCSNSGGGHVVVPKGEWLMGILVFQSNCNLYLSEGSTLVFSDNPDDYLPEMICPWEGIMCQNYSPMVYARRCNNIGISGPGTLRPIMNLWSKWIKSSPGYVKALQTISNWGAFDQNMYLRSMTGRNANLRPPLIQFLLCSNIVLQDFTVRGSPFWSIHMYRCEEGVARRLDVAANIINNDGIVLEMTKRFVVEDCTFDQGGDAISIKAGRNHEGWRINQPSRDIIVRNCTIKQGKSMFCVGSELSSGISNVYVHDCCASDTVETVFYVKTNRRRGAYVRNIIMERCEAAMTKRVLGIDTDVMYQWRNIVKTLKDSVTDISDITMRDVKCGKTMALIDLNGDKSLPVRNVLVSNIHADSVTSFLTHVENVKGYKEDSISYRWYGHTNKPLNIPK